MGGVEGEGKRERGGDVDVGKGSEWRAKEEGGVREGEEVERRKGREG